VGRDDAALIVRLRTEAPERIRYVHPVSPDVRRQEEWIEAYQERAGDYYWVVERKGSCAPEGLIGLYHLDEAALQAEWGRWVLRPGSLAAAESALLLYRLAFTALNLRQVYCLTVAENLPVLSFHDTCGLRRESVVPGAFTLQDGIHDAVKHVCEVDHWPAVEQRLEPMARQIGQKLMVAQ